MSEIPKDIMETAKAAHAQFADSRVKMNLGEIIARAILAERERCATIAEAIRDDGWGGKLMPASKSIAAATAERIATAIRGGSNERTGTRRRSGG